MNIGSTSGSAFTVATSGIQQGNQQVREASQQVVEATTTRPAQGTVEVTDPLMKLKEGERQVEVNAKTLEAADNNVGTLIDTLA